MSLTHIGGSRVGTLGGSPPDITYFLTRLGLWGESLPLLL